MEARVTAAPRATLGHHRCLDGLRGLAVAAVVLYHFAPQLVPGGFLGVDVFFVLSGFLITSLILEEHHSEGAFSVGGFLSRRLRRLLPAALATIIICVGLTWWLEPISARTTMRTQSLSSLLNVNNWAAIASGSTYESRFGRDQPLSHFWSLAVEEQFYILFPLLILGLILVGRRLRSTTDALPRILLLVSTLAAIGSAALMAIIHTPGTDPSRVYFGSDTRIQAIFIGVAAACLHRRVPRDAPSRGTASATAVSIGALLVLLGAFVVAGFRQEWLYNGGFLAVALLTAALIWTVVRTPARSIERVLAHRWLVGLGLVSYGIYLWHWPARAFITTSRTGLDGIALFTTRIVATAAATAVSFLLIERPFRRPSAAGARRRRPSPRQFATAAAAVAATAVLCLILTIPTTTSGSTPVAAPPKVDPADTGPVRVYLVGDSVAWTIVGGEFSFPQPSTYVSTLDPDRVALWNRSRFGHSLLRWPKRTDTQVTDDCPTCDPVIDWETDLGLFRPDLVVHSATLWDTYDVEVDGTWIEFGTEEFEDLYLQALERLRVTVTGFNSRLVLMVQPTPGNYPSDWAPQYPHDAATFPQINALLRQFAASHDDVGLIDLEQELCPSQRCIATDTAGRTLRFDGLHFSAAGAAYLSPILTGALESQALLAPTDAALGVGPD